MFSIPWDPNCGTTTMSIVDLEDMWADSYTKGLDLLGFQYKDRTQPFQGAAGATHPVLAEAVTQFQAQAYKELLPAGGPVRAQILGKITRAKQDQAVPESRIS